MWRASWRRVVGALFAIALPAALAAGQAATGPRGRQGSPAPVALPEGWLADPDDCTVPAGADVMHSGG